MRIAVLHAGGLGDLVLVETLLAGLRERHPEARVELVCRADVAETAALYADPPDAVHAFDFNPYLWATPAEASEPSARFLATFTPGVVDLFVSAELQATWMSEILAAALVPSEAIFADPSTLDRGTARIVVRMLDLQLYPHVRRLPRVANEHELDRYARIVDGARRMPRLRPLRRTIDEDERPIVVFPLGSTELKRWPFERFSDACAALFPAAERALILVGSDAERPELEGFAQAEPARNFGVTTGGARDVVRIADVLANAAGYLGVDTGLAHLAAAYGVPGVTIYGGGHWPAYAPWATRSAGVVAPIPCFGCRWDCAFDHAYCVEAIPVDDVVHAFRAALAAELPLVVENEAYSAEERTIFDRASRVYRAAQADRAARFRAIIRLRDISERYALRTRTRQAGTSASLDDLTGRLTVAARRLGEASTAREG